MVDPGAEYADSTKTDRLFGKQAADDFSPTLENRTLVAKNSSETEPHREVFEGTDDVGLLYCQHVILTLAVDHSRSSGEPEVLCTD